MGGKAQACSQGDEGPRDIAAPSNGLELRPQAREQVGCCGHGDLAAEQHQGWVPALQEQLSGLICQRKKLKAQ